MIKSFTVSKAIFFPLLFGAKIRSALSRVFTACSVRYSGEPGPVPTAKNIFHFVAFGYFNKPTNDYNLNAFKNQYRKIILVEYSFSENALL